MDLGRWLVVGLGNPGREYAGNRHNVGFMVVDVLARRAGAGVRSHRTRAEVADCRLADRPVSLVKPRTYMNESGPAVRAVVDYYDVPLERLLVVHDDLDIPFGALRLKRGGGSGGHNGLRSLTRALGTSDFFRVRIGIGRPPGRMDPAVYVLRDFSTVERKELPVLVERAADAVEAVIRDGLESAQNIYHAA